MTCIAIVDDDHDFLDLMREALALEGYETIMHPGSGDSFPALRDQHVDLIVIDIRMEQPDSGWLLLDLLRSDVRTRTIPVLVCSAACDDLRSHEAWLSDRHIDALHKPFDIDDLYAAVRRALSQQRQVHPAIFGR